MSNHLIRETSPYLLQHAENDVNWYPWCDEAFEKAKEENKPVFLSIGYSTCHWCHVMAHESFENKEIAKILNNHFISIKVDKEERPDIDSVYMAVCQAFTGNGGWPTSIFMTPEQKPFFAGTYFPVKSQYGMIGFGDLLSGIAEKWNHNQSELLNSAEDFIKYLKKTQENPKETDPDILESAVYTFQKTFDKKYGGFGNAPKFPSPHNLLFLTAYAKLKNNADALHMVKHTLTQMRKGGIFDHIGYGFSRYSTDRIFLVPHFEKMLYDNALLILAYSALYTVTNDMLYLDTAEKTAAYILREMTSPEGAFYSAQDADSNGIEGKYYVFGHEEIISILGESAGKQFNSHYGITEQGNFDGANIPNRLTAEEPEDKFVPYLSQLYEYRKKRTKLHLDDKVLTSWNSLMISAFAVLYKITGKMQYLSAAQKTQNFIEKNLTDGDTVFVSYRDGLHSGNGFLDDYAFYSAALLALYDATLDISYLDKAQSFCRTLIRQFSDEKSGGFYLSGEENEQLIFNPKDTYDGAIPSGNSISAYNFVKLFHLTDKKEWEHAAKQQLDYLAKEASTFPSGHSMFLLSLLIYQNPPPKITIVLKNKADYENAIKQLPIYASVQLLDKPSQEYKLLNEKTSFYVCTGNTCLPPVNEL